MAIWSISNVHPDQKLKKSSHTFPRYITYLRGPFYFLMLDKTEGSGKIAHFKKLSRYDHWTVWSTNARVLKKLLLPTYTIVGDPLTSRNPTQFKYTLDYLKKVRRTVRGHLFKEKDIGLPFRGPLSRWSYSGHLCPFKMDRGLQIRKK